MVTRIFVMAMIKLTFKNLYIYIYIYIYIYTYVYGKWLSWNSEACSRNKEYNKYETTKRLKKILLLFSHSWNCVTNVKTNLNSNWGGKLSNSKYTKFCDYVGSPESKFRWATEKKTRIYFQTIYISIWCIYSYLTLLSDIVSTNVEALVVAGHQFLYRCIVEWCRLLRKPRVKGFFNTKYTKFCDYVVLLADCI
jgi:hypothetical protein